MIIDKKQIEQLRFISILLIILWIFRVPSDISKLTQIYFNFDLRFTEGIFVYIPTMIVIAISNKKTRLPYLFIYTIFAFFYIIMESNIFRLNAKPIYSALLGFSYIYWYFLLMVNLAKNYELYKKVIQIAYYCTVFIFIVILLGYLGIININILTDLSSGTIQNERIMSKSFHINRISLQLSFGIFLLIIMKMRNIKIFNLHISNLWFWVNILLYLFIIIIHSTRGAFAISLIGIFIYLFYNWKKPKTFYKLIFIGFFIALFFTLNINLESYFSKFHIYERYEETSLYQGRGLQIIATWNNFINNPWVGVGYYYAARGLLEGITESNFSYTQILASHGIFFFILYLSFLKKLFVTNFQTFKKQTPLLLLIAGFMPLMFYNLYLSVQLSVIAYLVFYERIIQKKENIIF